MINIEVLEKKFLNAEYWKAYRNNDRKYCEKLVKAGADELLMIVHMDKTDGSETKAVFKCGKTGRTKVRGIR